jgi:hypothetical protein
MFGLGLHPENGLVMFSFRGYHGFEFGISYKTLLDLFDPPGCMI